MQLGPVKHLRGHVPVRTNHKLVGLWVHMLPRCGQQLRVAIAELLPMMQVGSVDCDRGRRRRLNDGRRDPRRHDQTAPVLLGDFREPPEVTSKDRRPSHCLRLGGGWCGRLPDNLSLMPDTACSGRINQALPDLVLLGQRDWALCGLEVALQTAAPRSAGNATQGAAFCRRVE